MKKNEECSHDDARDLLRELKEKGYYVLENFGTDAELLDHLADHLNLKPRGSTFWEKYYLLRYEVGSDVLSNARTWREICLHTDGSFEVNPPRYFILQCLLPDEEPHGSNILVDGISLLSRLPSWVKVILSTERFLFCRKERAKKSAVISPIILKDPIKDGQIWIRYRNDHNFSLRPVNDKSVEKSEIFKALAVFEEILYKVIDKKEIYLKKGDVVIIDNYRMLHGRRKLSQRKERVLRRLWLDE